MILPHEFLFLIWQSFYILIVHNFSTAFAAAASAQPSAVALVYICAPSDGKVNGKRKENLIRDIRSQFHFKCALRGNTFFQQFANVEYNEGLV